MCFHNHRIAGFGLQVPAFGDHHFFVSPVCSPRCELEIVRGAVLAVREDGACDNLAMLLNGGMIERSVDLKNQRDEQTAGCKPNCAWEKRPYIRPSLRLLPRDVNEHNSDPAGESANHSNKGVIKRGVGNEFVKERNNSCQWPQQKEAAHLARWFDRIRRPSIEPTDSRLVGLIHSVVYTISEVNRRGRAS